MSNLKEQIRKSRNIKETSLNTYICALHILHKRITGEKIPILKNAKFLHNFKINMDAINKEQKLTSKKNKLTAILVALNSEDPKKEELIDNLSAELKRLGDTYTTFLKQQKKTDTQKANWINYEDVVKIANDLMNDVKVMNIHRKKKGDILTNKEFDKLKQYLILRTYLTFPIRNDYANMRILKKKTYEKLPNEEREENNYLVLLPANKKQFHINQFKNKKVIGAKILNVPTPLNKIINLWLKFNKSGYYLVKSNRTTPMSPNSITKFLNKIFRKNADGKKISSSMLRHIIISHMLKGTKTIKEKEEDEKKIQNQFFHSAEMNQKYRKLDDEENKE